MLDPDDVTWIQLDWALDDLETAAHRLSDPAYAYARWWSWIEGLLRAGVGRRVDLIDLCSLAARLTVVELRRML